MSFVVKSDCIVTAKAQSGTPAPRNVWIDGLRGFCVFAVMCTHGLVQIPSTSAMANHLASPFVDKGYFAVATFFVISGFLITSNTLRRYGQPGKINFGQFYTMRVARIMPPLLLFMAIMVLLGYSGIGVFTPPSKQLLWGSVYAALTFQYNIYYFVANAPGLAHWSPLWSLSIEEMFYLTFPIACFLVRRRLVLVCLLAALVIVGPFARQVFTDVFNFWGAADLLALGCLMAIASDQFRPRLSSLSGLLLGIGIAVILCVFSFCQVRENFRLTPTLLGFGAGLFLVGAAAAAPGPRTSKIVGAIAALGRASYEIYIFHAAMIMVLRPPVLALITMLGAPDLITQLATSVVLLAIVYWSCSWLSRSFTEPLNARIRRFYSGTSG